MKKKSIIFLVIGMCLVSSVSTYAATKNYYADLLAGQQQEIAGVVAKNYNEKSEARGKAQHNDLVMYVETKRQDIIAEVNAYAESKINKDANSRLNEHTEAINAEAERMTKELKQYIDNINN